MSLTNTSSQVTTTIMIMSTEHFHHSTAFPLAPFVVLPLPQAQALEISFLISVTVALPLLKVHINGLIQYAFSRVSLLSLSTVLLRFISLITSVFCYNFTLVLCICSKINCLCSFPIFYWLIAFLL